MIGLGWREREPPLSIVGMLVTGESVSELAGCLLRMGPESLRALRMASNSDGLVVLGAADILPWVDGALWLGRDGGILYPTALEPDQPADLVAGAIVRQFGRRGLVVVTTSMIVVSNTPEGPPSQQQLASLVTSHQGKQ